MSESLGIWHHRLGHVNYDTIKEMESSGVVDRIAIVGSGNTPFCERCIFGKHHRQPFPTDGRRRGKRIGDIIRSDGVGAMTLPSLKGARYFVIFKDDYSSSSVVNFMKKKTDVPVLLKKFVYRLEVETSQKVNTFRTDNGGEFMSTNFSTWLQEKGIRHDTSVAKTPQQKGVAERQNRMIIESARCMLHSTGQSLHSVLKLWAEATNCAVYLQN